MKAIRVHQFGGPEVLGLEEIADPVPGPGQVLVAIRAAGVNPVETYMRAGTYAAKPPLPWTPGSDAAGVVQAVGPDVAGLRVGDRVYTGGTLTGAYAELALCDQAQVHPLPGAVSFEQGAGIHVPAVTAWRALFLRGGAKPGETVLVHGASGGVGTAAVQLARAAGLTVIGTAGSEAGRKLVQDQGAHHVLDHAAPGYLGELARITDGRGPDLILEMLANVNLGKDLGILARFGRVVVVGSRGTVEINPRDLMARDADIRAMTLMNSTPGELAMVHAALGAALAGGVLRPVVGQRLPLGEAAKAHERVLAPGSFGKIVLLPG